MEKHEYEELVELIKSEGDERRFKYKGYECVIKRVPEMLHLCGYIKIPKGHALYGDKDEEYGLLDIPVHGGVTFNGDLEEDGGFWIGFDCAHAGDLVPMMEFFIEKQNLAVDRLTGISQRGSYIREDTYRDMVYVAQNIRDMVDFIEEKLGNQKRLGN